MKLSRIMVLALMPTLLLLTACSLNSYFDKGEELSRSDWSYNYFYKDALYNFVFNFEDASNLKITVTDDSIPPGGESRASIMDCNYYLDGNVLTIVLKDVKDDLHLINTNVENNRVDMLYSVDSNNSLSLIRAHNLFPMLPNEVVLGRMNV